MLTTQVSHVHLERKMISFSFAAVLMLVFGKKVECGKASTTESPEDRYKRIFSYCTFYKKCIAHPAEHRDKVCAYDIFTTHLAIFTNICEVHKMNCEQVGRYAPVEMQVCNIRDKYSTRFADELQWVKITQSTSRQTLATVYFPDLSINNASTDRTFR